MSRYIADYTINKPDDLIKFIAEDFLTKEGFRQTVYKGETVWKKGVGAVSAPQFIKLQYGQGKRAFGSLDQILWRARRNRFLRRAAEKRTEQPGANPCAASLARDSCDASTDSHRGNRSRFLRKGIPHTRSRPSSGT